MSGNDLEFIDVIVLKKIDVDSTVESFGSKLGGIFEAANILGGIKLKGYIDIHSIIGNSPVIITDKGNSLLRDLEVHSKTPISKIDKAVLDSIKNKFSEPAQISRMLNINSRDIAYSLNKLWANGYLDVDSHNGKTSITLTRLGFEEEFKFPKEKEDEEESIKNKLAKEIIDDEGNEACNFKNKDCFFRKNFLPIVGGLFLLVVIISILYIVLIGI